MSIRYSFLEAKKHGLIDDIPKGLSRYHNFNRQRTVCSIDGDLPQEILWRLVCTHFHGLAVYEYKKAIPGRRFSLDIAFISQKLCIEIDGWEFHGKYLSSFKKDREKQNLLTMQGWSILRFFPEEIFNKKTAVIQMIDKTLEMRASVHFTDLDL
jgi:very-short-patch-repair endonuclease